MLFLLLFQVSRPLRLPWMVNTLITNAHSPQISQSEVESSSKYFYQCQLADASINFCFNDFCFYFRGVVLSTKMRNTVVLRRDYLHYIKKYNRFEKRHHNLPAHCTPAFGRTKTGDIVTVGQCRPISKTVRFNVCRVEKQRVEGNVRKTFIMF